MSVRLELNGKDSSSLERENRLSESIIVPPNKKSKKNPASTPVVQSDFHTENSSLANVSLDTSFQSDITDHEIGADDFNGENLVDVEIKKEFDFDTNEIAKVDKVKLAQFQARFGLHNGNSSSSVGNPQISNKQKRQKVLDMNVFCIRFAGCFIGAIFENSYVLKEFLKGLETYHKWYVIFKYIIILVTN